MNRPCDGPILLVGEGDFSLSVSLRGLRELKDIPMTATSLLTLSEIQLHRNAGDNIRKLENDGVEVFLGVDATHLSSVSDLQGRLFQRIIFNFPHVGGKSNIKKNRQLLKEFFLSACTFLEPGGELHVTLAKGQGGTPADQPMRNWKDSWQVVAMAAYADLILVEALPFNKENFPEYSSTGFRSQDRHFYTGDAITHIFIQSKPVNVLLPTDKLVTEIAVEGRNCIIGRYVADKMSRNLLNAYQHPIGHIKRCLEEKLSCQVKPEPLVILKDSQLPVVLSKSPSELDRSYRYYIFSKVEDREKRTIVNIASSTKHLKPNNFAESAQTTQKDLTIQTENFMTSPNLVKDCLLQNGTLRTTLLENVLNNDIGANTLYIASGDVYRRCPVELNELPVQHEMVGYVINGSNICLASVLLEVVRSVVPSYVEVILESLDETEVQSPPWISEYMGVKEVVKVESLNRAGAASVQNTERHQLENNLFCPGGPIGYVGFLKENQQCSIFVLNLNLLTQIVFNIPEARLLWTDHPRYLSQYKKLPEAKTQWPRQPASLYPPLWTHDISFWLDKERKFDEMEYFDTVRNFAGDCIQEVILMNTWTPPGTNDVSKCYRGIYQSCDQALSHFKAHEIQKILRLKVADELGVTLR